MRRRGAAASSVSASSRARPRRAGVACAVLVAVAAPPALAEAPAPSAGAWAARTSTASNRRPPCGCGGACADAPRVVRAEGLGWAVPSGPAAPSRPDPSDAASGPAREIVVWPVAARTATAAAAAWAESRNLVCGEPRRVGVQALLPVDGGPRAVERPVLAPKKGVTGPGSPDEAAYARVLALATLRVEDEDLLPIEVAPAGLVAVPGGRAQAAWLVAGPLGAVARVVGPVLELGAPAREAPAPPPAPAPPGVGREAQLRVWLDDARDRPPPAEVDFEVPGAGRWARPIVAADVARVDRSDVGYRLAVAHGVAGGFVTASVLVTIFDEPECFWMCEGSPFGFDDAYAEAFARRPAASVERDRRVLRGLDVSIAALGVLTVLAPSARHGVLSRWEILEDAAILAEGVLVAYTTPLSLESRFARARPIAFHPELGPEASPRTRVGPPFMAYGANRSGAWLGGVLAMLITEEAPWPYTLSAGLALGGLTAASAYFEVRAGLAYPSDIPLSLIYGAINGAGTFMWHRWFWGGWPGTRTGDAPLRIQGLGLVATPGGGAVSARLSF